jgi:hypothetical protein
MQTARKSECLIHGTSSSAVMATDLPNPFKLVQAGNTLGPASAVWWSEFLATQRSCIVLPVRYELNLYKSCRRK